MIPVLPVSPAAPAAAVSRVAYVALGSNLDRPQVRLRQAIAALAALPQVAAARASSLYRSPPWDGSAQPDYINAVVELHWRGSAEALFAVLQALELEQGRQRDPQQRNQPRTLDLDLLLFEGLDCATPVLTLPHPRMLARAFVMVPLAELAPTLPMADGRDAATHAALLAAQPLQRLDPATP